MTAQQGPLSGGRHEQPDELVQVFDRLAASALAAREAMSAGSLTPEEKLRLLLEAHALIEEGRGLLPAELGSHVCIPRTSREELVYQRMLEMDWPPNVTEPHLHLAGSLRLLALRHMAVVDDTRGVGRHFQEFRDQFYLDPERTASLDEYLAYRSARSASNRGTYERVEHLQSGARNLEASIKLALDEIFSFGGCLLDRHGLRGEPLFRVNRVELRFNPLKRTAAALSAGRMEGQHDVDQVMIAANSALDKREVGSKRELRGGFILCFGRELDHDTNLILARKIVEWLGERHRIVGIDLAGPESVNPLAAPGKLAEMKELFDMTGKSLWRTIHCGETPHVNLLTFVRTIEALNPDRVAHPIAAYRGYVGGDERGLRIMQERGIAAELCFISNLTTKAVASPQEFRAMVDTFDKFGIPYMFGTDASGMQGKTFAEEIAYMLITGAASEEQILRALEVGNNRSFLVPRQ